MNACVESQANYRVILSRSIFDKESPPRLPTRVIDIGQGTHHPLFLETNGLRAFHVALSHCWGPSEKRRLATRKDDVRNHLEGIPFSSLPYTFQDALIVMR